MNIRPPIWLCLALGGLLAVVSAVAGNWAAQTSDPLTVPGNPHSFFSYQGPNDWLLAWQGKGEIVQDIFVVSADGLTTERLANLSGGFRIVVEDNDVCKLFGIGPTPPVNLFSPVPAEPIGRFVLAQGTKAYCLRCLKAIETAVNLKDQTFCWLTEVPK